MKFSERVTRAREYARLTQKGLADRINHRFGSSISQQAISKLEQGSESSGYTIQIASVCGVSTVWLSNEEGQMVDPPGQTSRIAHKGERDIYISGASTKRLARIVELWHHLTDDSQQHFLDRIEACVVRAQSLPEPSVNLNHTKPRKKARQNVK